MTTTNDPATAFQRLVETIKALRDPENGCPWDLKQTHSSLKQYLIEEAYELIDAIDGEPAAIQEELGDVLLQVLLHSQIAADEDRFTITDVVNTITDKMIERHPHVFGNENRSDAEAVARIWEQQKQSATRGLLAGISKSLPALQKAHLIGARTTRVGFDWENAQEAAKKVREEVEEYLTAISNGEPTAIEEEFGDLLFSLAQVSRKQSFNAEEALQRACAKFTTRFEHMEAATNKPLAELTTTELEQLWQAAKKKL